MNDLRRIGKTKILRKMEAEAPKGWLTSFSDLEGTHTAEELAAMVYKDSSLVLGKRARVLRTMRDWLGKGAGIEIGGVLKLPDGRPIPWKEALRTTFDDVAEALRGLETPHRMVFFWDEVPYLLDNIAKRQGRATAEEVLDLLRELSQRHDNIRLLLTGSIGIHHVLRGLWSEGYRGSPLNHMDLIQPGPLLPEHAVDLARSEISCRTPVCADLDSCAKALSASVGHVPFYIQKLVDRLPRNVNLTPERVQAELDAELRSDGSDWDLDYYRRRVKTVFSEQEPLVLAILDAIASSPKQALGFQEVRSQVSAKGVTDDEILREHLKLLCMDHYLVRNERNEYRFYLELIRRWWITHRSL